MFFASFLNMINYHLELRSCADVGGLAKIDLVQKASKIDQAPAVDKECAKFSPPARKPKDAPKEHKELQIETRPNSYEEELRAKVALVETLFEGCKGAPVCKVEVFPSPAEHYRMRVEFDIWKTDDALDYVMHNGKERVAVNNYPMGVSLICDTLMPTLRAFHTHPYISERGGNPG